MKTIEIIVSPQGEARIQTKGFKGSSCIDGSRFLELALGVQQTERLTEEFYQQHPAATERVQQRGGP